MLFVSQAPIVIFNDAKHLCRLLVLFCVCACFGLFRTIFDASVLRLRLLSSCTETRRGVCRSRTLRWLASSSKIELVSPMQTLTGETAATATTTTTTTATTTDGVSAESMKAASLRDSLFGAPKADQGSSCTASHVVVLLHHMFVHRRDLFQQRSAWRACRVDRHRFCHATTKARGAVACHYIQTTLFLFVCFIDFMYKLWCACVRRLQLDSIFSLLRTTAPTANNARGALLVLQRDGHV